MKNKLVALICAFLLLILALCVRFCSPEEAELAAEIIVAVMEVIEEYEEAPPEQEAEPVPTAKEPGQRAPEKIPVFSGEPYVVINGNTPFFREEEYTTESYEFFSELDELGRCGMVMACIGQDLMPRSERGDIGHVKPAGWHSVSYDCVEGGSLYNRCHLLGFQLTGENANRQNLITGTRFMNVEGMLPFEDMVADFIRETDEHVLYRVTPIYEKPEDLVAIGVVMEGWSVEDKGESICFCVFVYKSQPGIGIDYATGESWEE